jgi:hypothetical protein
MSADIERFFNRMRNHNRSNRATSYIDPNNGEELTVWRQAWAAAASGACNTEELVILMKALLGLSDAAYIIPPVDDIASVLERVVIDVYQYPIAESVQIFLAKTRRKYLP